MRTVQEEGWSALLNGELLRRASGRVDVLLTADQRLPYQQNVREFNIGVVVLDVRDTRLPNLQKIAPEIRAAIDAVAPRSIAIVRGA